ncbi:hypothetical protein VNO78_31146 [Psophocarpus tetragonolobus]|uniref:Uncharacterized protein n=1 Tax=Psophocarpus tetragonolobus TaxID=3891 RepID=A0AAN9RYS8_PSOTE
MYAMDHMFHEKKDTISIILRERYQEREVRSLGERDSLQRDEGLGFWERDSLRRYKRFDIDSTNSAKLLRTVCISPIVVEIGTGVECIEKDLSSPRFIPKIVKLFDQEVQDFMSVKIETEKEVFSVEGRGHGNNILGNVSESLSTSHIDVEIYTQEWDALIKLDLVGARSNLSWNELLTPDMRVCKVAYELMLPIES